MSDFHASLDRAVANVVAGPPPVDVVEAAMLRVELDQAEGVDTPDHIRRLAAFGEGIL